MLVSTNPRHDLFGGEEEPNDKDIVFLFDNKNFSKDAELAFNYMKWNNITISSLNKGNDLITRDSLKDNFEKEYRSFIKSLDKKGLPKVERTKEIITSKVIGVNDAEHIAVAENQGCKYILTLDGDFKYIDSEIKILKI